MSGAALVQARVTTVKDFVFDCLSMIEEQVAEQRIDDKVAVAEVCSGAITAVRARLREEEALNASAILAAQDVLGHTAQWKIRWTAAARSDCTEFLQECENLLAQVHRLKDLIRAPSI